MPTRYIYEQPSWPDFTGDAAAIAPGLPEVRFRQGMLPGRMAVAGFELSASTVLESITDETHKSCRLDPLTTHIVAPAACGLAAEMQAFLTWFNGAWDSDHVLKAATAHLWFVSKSERHG